jgi:hypothetical protein
MQKNTGMPRRSNTVAWGFVLLGSPRMSWSLIDKLRPRLYLLVLDERRQTTRYSCELPLNITRAGARRIDWFERTLNISSSGGVCFHSRQTFVPGERVQYILTLSQAGQAETKLSCSGVVVRRRPVSSGVFEIAVTMDKHRFAGPDPTGIFLRAASENAAQLASEMA